MANPPDGLFIPVGKVVRPIPERHVITSPIPRHGFGHWHLPMQVRVVHVPNQVLLTQEFGAWRSFDHTSLQWTSCQISLRYQFPCNGIDNGGV